MPQPIQGMPTEQLEDIVKVCKSRIKKDRKGYWLRRGWFERLIIAEEILKSPESPRGFKRVMLDDYGIDFYGKTNLKYKIYIKKFKV